jgi:thiopeptide-type bacteriocin biosynthesis protein
LIIYQREIERYGEDLISTTEELFFYVSLLYLHCLEHKDFAGDDQIRFMSALKNMDRWLNLFYISFEEKAGYCMERSEAFPKEYGNEIKLQLNFKYREFKNLLPSFLNSKEYDYEFDERDKKLEEMKLTVENLSSYIHMSMNRWFNSEQRLMECMAYLFCNKYYNQVLRQSNEK